MTSFSFCQQVQYECDGFLDKNRDTVFEELINILKASQVDMCCIFSVMSLFLYMSAWQGGWLPGVCVCLCVCQSELVAELFQQQGNVSSVANGGVRSGKRPTREHKLTVGFQVSFYDCILVFLWNERRILTTLTLCFVFMLFLCLSVPSVLTDANGHSQQHHASLCPLY